MPGRRKADKNGRPPEAIPDWANDGHTLTGKLKGRGPDYFRTISTLLVQPAAEIDPCEHEACRLWKLKAMRKIEGRYRLPVVTGPPTLD